MAAATSSTEGRPEWRDSEKEESEPLLEDVGEEEPKKDYGASGGLKPAASIADEVNFGRSERVATIAQELEKRGDRYDWIVEAHAFQEYPHALLCARLTYVLLALVVLISIAVLVFYYALGVVQIQREYYWYDQLQVPTLIICPDWGRRDLAPGGFRGFVMGDVARGKYPSAEGLSRTVNHSIDDCLEQGDVLCKCIGFGDEYLEKQEHNTDLVSVRFDAISSSQAFLFGFREPGRALAGSHTFAYGLLGTRSLGYLTMHLLDVRDKKVTMSLRGGNMSSLRDTHLYDWEIAGHAVPSTESEHTELLFGFKTFQVARDQTFAAIWSPFAIATVIAMAMSLLNNLNIFGLAFPVQQHPIFTQREPSILIRGLCGCFPCMRRRQSRLRPRTRLESLLEEHQELIGRQGSKCSSAK